MFRNLRAYLEALERRGELHRVRVPVSAELEIAEIAEVLAFPIDGDRDIQFGRGHGDIGASMENHRG